MIRKALPIFFLLFFALRATAAIEAVVSHSVFYLADSGKAYAEVYWQINPGSLHYMRDEQKAIFAKLRTDISFSVNGDIISEDHFFFQTTPAMTQEEVLQHSIIDLRRYILSPGLVEMHLKLTDITDSNNKFSYTDTFTVAAATSGAYFSTIQLLDTIYASNANTRFQKNDRQQIPLCTNFYDQNRNNLRYYFELYGTDKISKDDYPLVQRVYISKRPNEDIYPKLLKIDTIRAGQVIPCYGKMSLTSIPSGNYYVNIALDNNSQNTIAYKAFLFQRYNNITIPEDTTTTSAALGKPTDKVVTFDLNKTFLAKYNTTQIKLILKMMLPMADPVETQTIQGFLKKPDDMYMRYFIFNYFTALNKKDPAEAWKDYSAKVIEVNKMFGIAGNGQRGFETDRGIIYLRYGKPNDRIDVENETGTYPYEIWQYTNLTQSNKKNVRNGLFLFYKPSDLVDDYRLLHSNVSGEIQNPDWRQKLYTNSSGGNNLNSRAEQYFENR